MVALRLIFTEYDYIDENEMVDLYTLKSLAPPIPRRAVLKKTTTQLPGLNRHQGFDMALKEKDSPGRVIQQADNRFLGRFCGAAFLERCRNEAVREKGRHDTKDEKTYTLSTQYNGQLLSRQVSDGEQHPAGNHNTLHAEYTGGEGQPLDHCYEKLNKETMEFNTKSIRPEECSGVQDFGGPLDPAMPTLDSQNF